MILMVSGGLAAWMVLSLALGLLLGGAVRVRDDRCEPVGPRAHDRSGRLQTQYGPHSPEGMEPVAASVRS